MATIVAHAWQSAALALVTVTGMLLRPWRLPEWVFAVGGALGVLAVGALGLSEAWRAIGSGTSVYLFLAGIVMLAELARLQGVFAWVAGLALRASRGSKLGLLVLFYGVGVLTTVSLSNDTTVVALTPAVAAALGSAKIKATVYFFACALVANAASFLLPAGNPANLVVFGDRIPPFASWIAAFGTSAVVAIVLTFVLLVALFRDDVRGSFEPVGTPVALSSTGRMSAVALALAAIAVGIAFALRSAIGTTTIIAAVVACALVAVRDGRAPLRVARHANWGILPLVAGLFVIVAALDRAGGVALARGFFAYLTTLPLPLAKLSIGAATAVASAAFNNLPVALYASVAFHAAMPPSALAHASVVALDLSPNITVNGSLATILWITIVRREGVRVSPWAFFKVGFAVTVPTLALALALAR